MSLFPKDLLSKLGILDWGYTEDPQPASFHQFENWIDQKQFGSLAYLSDHRKSARNDIRNVYPAFQSALVFLFSYKEVKKWMLENDKHSVASYTLGFEGEDYHHALRRRLGNLGEHLKKSKPDVEYSYSLDIQPILERDLAYRAGLGWFGKNSMLISRSEGSYFIIGSLLLNQKIDIEFKPLDSDHCGTCNACAEACPTYAIDPETRTLKTDLCISTFTIEVFKEAEAPLGFENSRGEVFGCDICQDVCPWNKKTLVPVVGKIALRPEFDFLMEMFLGKDKSNLKEQIERDTNRGFRKKLQGAVFDRPGRVGWLKNLKALISSRSDS
jgi:epoxyqueuosine reductase